MAAALHLARTADPGFAVAAADLAVLDGTPIPTRRRTLRAWERHHIEVVGATASGHASRAVDLLRDHLSADGCDPIATAIVLAAAGGAEALDDLPAVHPWI
jgi:hypothetical protein